MNLTESQSESVVGLTPGLVAAHSDGMDRPVLVRIDASGSAREGIDLVPMHPPLSLRSHGCAQECKTSPCTLEELTISNEFAKKPAVLLWGEIVALGHLMGEPCGILKEEMKIFVQQVPMSRLRCAIGLVASSSVSRRSRWIRQFYDPRTLEVAIAEAMVSQVEDDSALGRPDASWQVGRFRWADVRRTLDAESGSVKSSSKIFTQPREWSARGLILREGSWSEVRANFQAAARSVQTPFSPTFLGEPNVLDPAAAALSEPGPRGARLSEAIRQVIALPNDWPSFRLYPETEQSNV